MKLAIAFFILASAVPTMCEQTFRCTDALCLNYLQEVGGNHLHVHRCGDAACVNYQAFVAANHRHQYRNRDVTSPNFLQFVPERQRRRK